MTRPTAAAEPRRHLLCTSAPLGWQDVQVEHRCHDAGEWEVPSLNSHMICLYVGPPTELQQRRGGPPRAQRIKAGHSQIVPSGVPSTWTHSISTEFIALHLSLTLLERIAHESGRARVELLNAFSLQDPQIESIGRELNREMNQGGPMGSLYAEHLGSALAVLLLRRYTGSASPVGSYRGRLPPHVLKKVTEYIDAHLTGPLRLAELAGIVGITPPHFAVLFRRSTGAPPHEFIIRRRVERACELLRHHHASIADAASHSGFYDQSHLARHMRRLLGVSPSRFVDSSRTR